MSDEPVEDFIQRAVRLNQERRGVRFDEAARAGAAYLVECRDLWDAHEADGGVYFVPCDTAAVTALALEFADDNPNDRLLGIYVVAEPLLPQGPGLTRAQWLVARTEAQ